MDYFAELADHQDTEEAVARVLPDVAAIEGRTARRRELMRRFYADPATAVDVWWELRYCHTFRQRLVDEVTCACERKAKAWDPRNQAALLYLKTLGECDAEVVSESLAASPLKQIAERFVRNPAEGREDFTATLSRALTPASAHGTDPARTLTDRLMAAAPTLAPDAPRLLVEVARELGVGASGGPNRDQVIASLLEDPVKVRQLLQQFGIPVPFSLMLQDELDFIEQARAGRGVPAPAARTAAAGETPIERAMRLDLVGLAFSGGGIRSATFNLGVLQALAKLGVLQRCDYLSTVSGGGYIGGWFVAWLRRLGQADGQRPARSPAEAFAELRARLDPTASPNPVDLRVRPIRYLREFSNYLTPQVGFFSADTWTMIAVYLRNAFLNQIPLILVLAVLLLLPRLVYATVHSAGSGLRGPASVAMVLMLVASFALFANLWTMEDSASRAKMPGDRSKASAKRFRKMLMRWSRQGRIQLLIVAPLFLVSLLASVNYWRWLHQANVHWLHVWMQSRMATPLVPAESIGPAATGSLLAACVVFVCLAAAQVAGRFDRCWPPDKQWRAIGAVFASLVGASLVGWAMGWAVGRLFLLSEFEDDSRGLWHALAVGPPLLLAVFSTVITVQIGLLGFRYPDERREWWSRLRAWTLIYSLVWLALFATVFYAPWGVELLLASTVGAWGGWGALAGWGWTTYYGVSKTNRRQTEGARSMPSLVERLGIAIAPYVFIAGLMVLIACVIHLIAVVNWGGVEKTWALQEAAYCANLTQTSTSVPLLLTVSAVMLGVAFLFSWRVGVNEFSMHHFYKNRLVRCYLGASRWYARQPNRFTGFDPSDDEPLADVTSDAYVGPYPIFNATLNLVSGEDLAWQERKGAAFVFTPKYCGYDIDRAVLRKNTDKSHADAYVPTRLYAYPDSGPRIGMAMGISGAAASASMGLQTTPASAFLMTVFNVRLGWWLGNPRFAGDCWKKPSPRVGMAYSLVELLGLTNDERGFVNLSDGGHFENLGVYELVRRGCRAIICCDAGQDGKFKFQDLGNVIRRCRTDFGVEIDIDLNLVRRGGDAAPASQSHCVVGTIRYPGVDTSQDENADRGWLLYLKPTVTGDEPFDVLEYARTVTEFPHESTADQWFTESQFEAYRRLGLHIGETTFPRFAVEGDEAAAPVTNLFENLRMHWYPPTAQVTETGTQLTDAYSHIMDKIRSNKDLKDLDAVLFSKVSSTNGDFNRERFYTCNALIQLMENVYVDLDLERNWEHPHVEGWRRLFQTWAAQDVFEETWGYAKETYASRFQRFYDALSDAAKTEKAEKAAKTAKTTKAQTAQPPGNGRRSSGAN